MTAPIGAIVSLYVDLFAHVSPGDVIETQTGRRYGVLTVREQERGKHVGRQHLKVQVIGPDDEPNLRVVYSDGSEIETGKVHRISWYKRGKAKRRR